MTVDYVGYFRQKITDIGADGRYAFELLRAPNLGLEGRSGFADGAIGRAVSG